MTLAPHAERLACTSLDEAIRRLRERDLRLSTARRLLLGALFDAEGPVSAERIARALGMEPTSVYRNLDVFERLGLVRHVHLGHGPGLYGLVGRDEHEYLACEQCGAIRQLARGRLDALRAEIEGEFGYQPRFTHFAIVGLCARCAKAPDSEAHPAEPGDAPGNFRGAHEQVQGRLSCSEQPTPGNNHAHAHSHGDHVHSHAHSHRVLERSHGHRH